jgi:thioredoxin-disulfide reductase
MYDLIIIGGGPAGMTAAIYAGRQKMNTLLITKDFGGQMIKKATEIENYPGFIKISNFDLIKKMEDQVRAQPDVEIVKGEVVKVENKAGKSIVSMQDGTKYESVTCIVATGADPRPLEVPGEKEFINKGVSYCALCDGPVFRNKDVAVIGGGNSGFETAIFLSNYVNRIYLLESGQKVSADANNQQILKNIGKTEIIFNAKVKEIKGDIFVKSLVYEDAKMKEQKELNVAGVFVEIGYQPATAFVKGLVDFSERDEIKTDPETYQTKTPGLYAAGDCNIGKFKQVITAAGEGAKAALAAYGYIEDLKYKK